jgi:YHS domain-containing protein
MKKLKFLIATFLVATCFAIPPSVRADESTNAPAKPYPLKTCLVCDMKFGDMGEPCVFVYQGQTIEVCDKDEKATFDKTPKKYLKKLADAEAKLKK